MDRTSFLERLPLVRSQGYAAEVNEFVEGLMGIASPILDFAGNTAGSLSLGFPATRENDQEFLDTAIRDLKHTASEISASMGYAGGSGAGEAEADSEQAAAE